MEHQVRKEKKYSTCKPILIREGPSCREAYLTMQSSLDVIHPDTVTRMLSKLQFAT